MMVLRESCVEMPMRSQAEIEMERWMKMKMKTKFHHLVESSSEYAALIEAP